MFIVQETILKLKTEISTNKSSFSHIQKYIVVYFFSVTGQFCSYLITSQDFDSSWTLFKICNRHSGPMIAFRTSRWKPT